MGIMISFPSSLALDATLFSSYTCLPPETEATPMNNRAIESLEQERSKLQKELLDVEDAIAVLRRGSPKISAQEHYSRPANAKAEAGSDEDLGAAVAHYRKNLGMSLRKLEKASGIPYSTIASIERGQSRLNADHLRRLSNVFGAEAGRRLASMTVGTNKAS